MEYLKLALAKGRLAKQTLPLLEKAGLATEQIDLDGRKLLFTDEVNRIQYILVKPSDVPSYVEHGAADLGIVGKDVLVEQEPDIYEVADLKIGKCKMAVAGPKENTGSWMQKPVLSVGTKYPKSAEAFFKEKGKNISIVKLQGSVELAPIVGLSDVIVDLVETGSTLKENGLVVFEDVYPVSARLIVNKVSLKMQNERIRQWIDAFRQ